MARNYQVEAVQKFPITAAPPLKDNYTDDAAYQWDSKEFQRQCTAVVACQWEWVGHQEAGGKCHQAGGERATVEVKAKKGERRTGIANVVGGWSGEKCAVSCPPTVEG